MFLLSRSEQTGYTHTHTYIHTHTHIRLSFFKLVFIYSSSMYIVDQFVKLLPTTTPPSNNTRHRHRIEVQPQDITRRYINEFISENARHLQYTSQLKDIVGYKKREGGYGAN